MPVRCFMLRDLPFERLWLRRYADGPCPSMPGEYSYHHAMTLWRERVPARDTRAASGGVPLFTAVRIFC